MNKIAEFFAKSSTQIGDFWKTLSAAKKITIVASSVVVTGILLLAAILGSRPTYQYLFTELPQEDIAAISSFFAKNNYTRYIVDSKGIKVPVEDLDHLRVQLSQEGLPNKGVVGWEQFDTESFTRTEFEQEILKLRAIQGELARTIAAVDGISSARVHIVMPKNSLFVRDQKKPTAAIYLNTKHGMKLEKKQIQGIQHLVSRSVEGLETNQITIIDSDGTMISEAEPDNMAAKQSQEILVYTQAIEKNLEERIRGIVGKVVGYERVDAKVDAQVDFTQEKQTIQNVDPEGVVVVSKNTTGSSVQGQSLNPTGIPGAKSNVPGEQEPLSGAAAQSGSKRESEIVNYDYSKTTSERTPSVGKILRLTVSAIVDGKQIYPLDGSQPDFAPRTSEEMKKIEELIKDAVGFKEGRDSLTVHNMMFQLDPSQLMAIKEQKKEDRAYLSTLAISAVIALAIAFFFGFVVRPYFRWLVYDPEKKEQMAVVEEYRPELETATMQRVKVQEEVPFEKMSPKDQVMYLARNEPKRTTEAIRILLSPTSGAV